MSIKSKAIAVSEERATYWLLVVAIVSSFVIYSILVNKTIHNVVGRQELDIEMSALTSRLSELEFEYISMQNELTIDKAYALGFKEVSAPKFVSRKSFSQVTLNNKL